MPKLDLEALKHIAPELYEEIKREEEATTKELNELRLELSDLFDKLKKAQQPKFDIFIPNAYSLSDLNQHCKLSFNVNSENVDNLGDHKQLIVDRLKCDILDLEESLIETHSASSFATKDGNFYVGPRSTNIEQTCVVLKITFLKKIVEELESK